MQRSEVWWARLPGPAGFRPVVLLTRNSAYANRTHATVAPVTRSGRPIRSHVPIGPEDGVPQPSGVNLDDIQTMPIAQLVRRITVLSDERMAEVDRAIKFALGLK
jgi:mRNA-degrading endonuclease toxin of MazEF toxin-antitoxin module